MSSLPHQIRPLNIYPFQISRLFSSTYQKVMNFPHKITPISTQFQILAAKSRENHLTQTQNNSQEDGIPSDHVKVLAKFKSKYNHIRVIEVSRRADHPFAGSRLLLLDKPGNIHSISFLFKQFTKTYFDVFATFPSIIPPGPLGILGFGAGSAAYLILELYPQVSIHGWELDPSVISIGREFFDLSKLEKENLGRLFVYIGDALEANVVDGFAGILVDLFCKGSLIPELQDRSTWEKLKKRLKKGGRIMVNVGGSCVESEDLQRDGKLVMEETLKSMHCVFADQVFVLNLGNRKEDSSIALTGYLPDLDAWKQVLPPALRCYVNMWTPLSKMI
ncbi:S-adenosyl-l-methionine-dependent methyltransferases superfamily protein [Thalictrum thalictroides]|uniref:S-adenosyl-l-methionine-dependent methyltransferases superfamily protein n=1 Tax=Thalictrum thalictroides TaxID=46969 RepID=A0A7J6UV12_THATH|nr:S-adenosyl-l-methionine-dependent methyltransferases superfamily protein [Thalictrum thalictroides]